MKYMKVERKGLTNPPPPGGEGRRRLMVV